MPDTIYLNLILAFLNDIRRSSLALEPSQMFVLKQQFSTTRCWNLLDILGLIHFLAAFEKKINVLHININIL